MSAPTALELAAAVRSGERSATDVLEEHLSRIAEREAEIHAFNLLTEDHARAAAKNTTPAVTNAA